MKSYDTLLKNNSAPVELSDAEQKLLDTFRVKQQEERSRSSLFEIYDKR